MENLMLSCRRIACLLTLVTLAALSQAQGGFAVRGQDKAGEQDSRAAAPADDISGMYSFLKDGEFVQLTLEEGRVTGYISRQGESDSDRGVFLDQFFEKASIQGHDVAFTTRPLHGVWFDFKGKYARGSAKTKTEDGYYLLRGTLKELSTGPDKNTVSRSREVEFKSLGQPDDSDQPTDKSKKAKT